MDRDSGIILQRRVGRQEQPLLEVGYLFLRSQWHKGYAAEAAMACRDYAFGVLGQPMVCSIIRDTNRPSQRVAERNGMRPWRRFVKHYMGIDMPHDVYVVEKEKTCFTSV